MKRLPLVVIAILGLLCVILGFVAEPYRSKRDDVRESDGNCIFNETPAFGLGLAAALLLVVDQILISSLAGCICCNQVRPEGAKLCIGVTCLVVSWVMVVPTLFFLLGGAILSASRTTDYGDDNGCDSYLRPGIFSIGAALSFVTVSLGIVYYIIASSAPPPSPVYNHGIGMAQPQMDTQPVYNHGIGMAQPQMDTQPVYNHGIGMAQPQMNTQPVFVHEDTYRRQQYP